MNRGFADNQSVEWKEAGGTAQNGMVYGPANSAIAYGVPGCALVPQIFRNSTIDRELPWALTELVGLPGCRLSDLNGGVWQRLSSERLPEFLLGLTSFISDLDVPEQETAVPAGVPFSWLIDLPLSNRLRNALLRSLASRLSNRSLPAPMNCREFLSIRNCGIKSLIELLCVLESVELGYSSDPAVESAPPARYRVVTDSDFNAAVTVAVHEALERSSIASLYLKDYCEWALSETEAVTVGSAIDLMFRGSSTPTEWKSLSNLQLTDLATRRPHPYEAIDLWVSSLPERERAIFLDRIACVDGQRTLQALADDLGVTRERIRQIEKKLAIKFDSHMRRSAGSTVHWRAESIRAKVGVARPLAEVQRFLLSADGQHDYKNVLLHLAGPYGIRGRWLVLTSAIERDPTADILANLDEFGFIDLCSASTELANWGLDSSLHRDWLLDTGRVKDFNGKLARWDVSIGDKIVAGLADLGRPATLDEVLAYIESDRTRGSAVNAISSDPRIVRVNLNQFGLTSWGVTEYVSISATIRDLVEKAGGSIQVSQVVTKINRDFGAAESSVRAYCGVPMFVIDDGWVSLRQDLTTFRYDTYSPRGSRGVFRPGDGQVSILMEVNEDVLRGSGRPLPPAVGALLDLAINDELVFTHSNNLSVTVTYPEASMSPSIGSLRPLVETLGAQLGDFLTLIFNKQNMSLQCLVTDMTTSSPSWELVAHLTGVEPEGLLNGLAAALDCRPGEVRTLLKQRGDELLADAIPTESFESPSLEEALARLEAQLSTR